MAHVDDQVGLVDGAVHKIAVGQGCVAQEVGAGFIDDAFTHLCGDHRDAQFFHKLAQHFAGQLAVGTGTGQQQGLACALDGFDGLADSLVFGNRSTGRAGLGDRHGGMFAGDIFRQFQVGGTGTLFLGQTEGLANTGGNAVTADHLLGELGERAHHVDHVDDLELALFAGLDRLLAGDHDHGHGAELGISSGGHQVGGTGAQGRHAHTGFAGKAAIGGCHKAGGLFVTGDNQLDVGAAQRLKQVQVFFTGNGKNVFYPFRFQGANEQIRCFHDSLSPVDPVAGLWPCGFHDAWLKIIIAVNARMVPLFPCSGAQKAHPKGATPPCRASL